MSSVAANLGVVFRARVEKGRYFLMMKAIELKEYQEYGGPAGKPRGNRLEGACFASGQYVQKERTLYTGFPKLFAI
jgi:hypothetical protein